MNNIYKMSLLLALLSGTFYTTSALIQRHLLKNKTQDSWAYSFWFSLVGVVASLPFLMSDIRIKFEPKLFVLLIFAGLLVTIHNYLNISSYKFISPSLQGALNKTRLLWVFLLAIVFWKSDFGYTELVGVLLTLGSGFLISRSFREKLERRGILLALSAAIVYASVITMYPIFKRSLSSAGISFFVFLIPAIINLLIMPNSLKRIYKILKEQKWTLIAANLFGALGFITFNEAIYLGSATKVIVLTESFLIITLALEHLVLKDKKHLAIKLIAALLALGGAISIQL